jgi:carbonic anhydrase
VKRLIEGIVEYRENLLPQYLERFQQLAHRQTPDTLFIGCSDSRVVPNLLVSTDPGDLFIVRNVGNMVPPANVSGASTSDVSEASAIEYAILALGVTNIVICGHSECGAMKAVQGRKDLTGTLNLSLWLHHARPAAFRLEQEGPLDANLAPHNQLSQINVLVQLENLMSYPIVRNRVEAGKLHLSGWWFEIPTGSVYIYDRHVRRFELIDRQTADRLLDQIEQTGNS